MVVPGELTLEREIEEINRFRPDVLMGYGSYLGALLRKAYSRGLRLPGTGRRRLERTAWW